MNASSLDEIRERLERAERGGYSFAMIYTADIRELLEEVQCLRDGLAEVRRRCFVIGEMRGDGEDSEYATAVMKAVMGEGDEPEDSINGVAYALLAGQPEEGATPR